MGYFISFVVEPDIEDGRLLYDRDDFVTEPLRISVPDLCKIIEAAMSGYQRIEVADSVSKREESDDETHSQGGSDQKTDHAYLISTEDFKEEDLNWLMSSLIQYLEGEVQSMPQEEEAEKVLQPEWGLSFSGLCEVSDLRNLLTTYVRKSKDELQDRYLFIFEE